MKSGSQEQIAAPGSERILLVDDEQILVSLWQEQFEMLGYRVVGLRSSLEALETFRRAPASFDIVITDMTMPFMTGDILAREILGIRPDVPVILCTGYSEKISDELIKELGVRAVVMKPMRINEITKIIRDALGGLPVN